MKRQYTCTVREQNGTTFEVRRKAYTAEEVNDLYRDYAERFPEVAVDYSTIKEVNALKELHAAFQITKRVVFEVSYYTLSTNETAHFSTCAARFNQPKTDFERCGQAQEDLLPKDGAAYRFYQKWDKHHVNDLTESQHSELRKDLEELKLLYNWMERGSEGGSYGFHTLKELSMQPIRKLGCQYELD